MGHRRYGADTGAFLVPLYGGGELPQAFCRVAAVAGALYVLRQPVTSVLLHPGSRSCVGIITNTGQVRRTVLASWECIISRCTAGDVSGCAIVQGLHLV